MKLGLDVKLNSTSSVPKSVLCYELDMVSTSNRKLPLTNLVPQIKRLLIISQYCVLFRVQQHTTLLFYHSGKTILIKVITRTIEGLAWLLSQKVGS